MKKDLKNVVVTFSLVVSMAIGNSIFYSKSISAEEQFLKQEAEYAQKELIAQQSMQLLLLEKSIEAQAAPALLTTVSAPTMEVGSATLKKQLAKADAPYLGGTSATNTPAPKKTAPVLAANQQASAISAQIQAEAEAKAKLEADALAKQIRDAKAAAKKQAEAEAKKKADAAAAKAAADLAAAEAARQSSAS